MTREHYKNFKQTVSTANEHDPVWYAGYAWIDLTKKQADDIVELLKVHPSVVHTENGLMLPSGLVIRL